uniref:Uncharacterized protein n=1 Tax=Arundo donax TaxID=35708 RepID=A0A0A9CAI6_ARUDO
MSAWLRSIPATTRSPWPYPPGAGAQKTPL